MIKENKIEEYIKKYELELKKIYGKGNMVIKNYYDGVSHIVKDEDDIRPGTFSVNYGRIQVFGFGFYQKYGQWDANIKELYFTDTKAIDIKMRILTHFIITVNHALSVQFVTLDYTEFIKEMLDNNWQIPYMAVHSNQEKIYHYVLYGKHVTAQTNYVITKESFTKNE